MGSNFSNMCGMVYRKVGPLVVGTSLCDRQVPSELGATELGATGVDATEVGAT